MQRLDRSLTPNSYMWIDHRSDHETKVRIRGIKPSIQSVGSCAGNNAANDASSSPQLPKSGNNASNDASSSPQLPKSGNNASNDASSSPQLPHFRLFVTIHLINWEAAQFS
jgi:hypothetical protein